MVRLLNAYITSLIALRDEVETNNRESLNARLQDALEGRARWLDERSTADWLKGESQHFDAPSFGDRVNQMLFGNAAVNRLKQRK